MACEGRCIKYESGLSWLWGQDFDEKLADTFAQIQEVRGGLSFFFAGLGLGFRVVCRLQDFIRCFEAL